MRTVLKWTAIAVSLAASVAGSVNAMSTAAPPERGQEDASLEQQMDAARRALGITPDPEPPQKGPSGRIAQWFNWPNWSNWPNWNNWGNWNNWVNW